MTRARAGAVVLLLAVTWGCATNPVTGKKQVSLMSEAEELAIGQQQDAEIRREMGEYDDRALQQYVSEIGHRLAERSHRPNLPWTFTIVDSPAINAFALPGGYVYITRGILPYLEDESELAGVLGHEIGHVTARHAAQQYTRHAQGSLGLAILSIFVPGTRPFTDLSSAGLSVLFLKHGRDDELEADRLGAQYGSSVGFDPAGVPRFLSTLARVHSQSERGVPNWLSTHPDPGSRVKEAEPVAAKFSSPSAATRNRDQYFERIDGVVVGDSLKDGIVRDNAFMHPMLRLAVEFPEGWDVINSPEQVVAREPGTSHYMLLKQIDQPRGRSLSELATAEMRGAGYKVEHGQAMQLNGLDAYVGRYRGSVKNLGKVVMHAAHVRVGRDVYVVAGLAPEADFDRVDRSIKPSLDTFRELSRDEAATIRPNRLDFYIVREGDSWQSIAARAGRNLVSASTLAIMNDHDISAQPQAGDRVKIVIAGSL
ncbi:MAG: M48 family metalloprotease [Vicinamibacterales bacterium]